MALRICLCEICAQLHHWHVPLGKSRITGVVCFAPAPSNLGLLSRVGATGRQVGGTLNRTSTGSKHHVPAALALPVITAMLGDDDVENKVAKYVLSAGKRKDDAVHYSLVSRPVPMSIMEPLYEVGG